MNVQFYEQVSPDIADWRQLFKSFDIGIQQIKTIEKFGEILTIPKPTGFILKKNNDHFAVGYSTKKRVNTKIFNPDVKPYEDNNVSDITLHNFHSAIYYRMKLLDLDLTNLTGVKYFELTRKCLLAVFVSCGLDIDILYERELKLLKHIESCDNKYFKNLKRDRDLMKIMYELYHDKLPCINEDFLDVYMLDLMHKTYKWRSP